MRNRPDTNELAVRIGLDAEAFDRLFERVYADLHRIARQQRRRVPAGSTLDTTALLHEVYLRLAEGRRGPLNDRAHFLAVAARAMRFVLIDHARERSASKRGGGAVASQATESELQEAVTAEAETLIAIDRALEHLGELNPRLVQVVECRYFAGLSEKETAAAVGVSLRTVQRDWNLARAKLRQELATGEEAQ